MRTSVDPLARFFRDQRGAATVDYVVLAAGVFAVAMAANEVISGGMSGLAGTVDSELRREPVEALTGITYTDGFDNGASGWIGAFAATIPGLGNVLGPIAGTGVGGPPRITRDFDIDPKATQATFAFDLYAMDSLDNESGIVYIDGLEVGRMTSDKGNAVFTAADAAELKKRGIIVRATTVDNNVDLGGNPSFKDSLSSISITIDKPKNRVTFGFGSTADQGTGDESFAIDSFQATGLRNTPK